MKFESQFYEILENIYNNEECSMLQASFTPNNGIRVQIANIDMEDDDWRVFDFTADQAELIGQALVRWAQRRRAYDEAMHRK